MRWLRTVLPFALILLLLIARTVTATLSHDENKFVYAGQALADHGRLPYRDYPYDQMPYAAFFYGIAASLSSYDFLASRLLGSLAWLGCFGALIAVLRTAQTAGDEGSKPSRSSLPLLLTELVVVLVFLFDPLSAYVLGAAKNNSFATLFALLAFLFFVRGVKGRTRAPAAAFWSGLFAALSGCTRLNYAILYFVLLAMWALSAWAGDRSQWLKLAGWCTAGAFAGALPALTLAAIAPAQFYYANVVQLRLTTSYYQLVQSLTEVSLAAQLRLFRRNVVQVWVNLVLYVVLIGAAALFVRNFLRRRRDLPRATGLDLVGLAAAAFSVSLLLTAFLARPMMDHYLFAPLPFLLILLALAAQQLWRVRRAAYAALLAVVLLALASRSTAADTISDLGNLLHPETWPPLQVHEAAHALRAAYSIAPGSRVLSLLPMIPAEAGFDAYPFTASGSNSWRTSPLLAADRRRLYGVVSPAELPAVLDAAPPFALLTGFEKPNPGFTFRDVGGLEVPLEEYARTHGYQPYEFQTGFTGRTLTLWLKP